MKTIRLTGGRKVPSKLQIKSAENKSTFIQYVGSYKFLFNMSVLVLFYKQFSKCFVGQNKTKNTNTAKGCLEVEKHTPRQKPSVVDCGCVAGREWTQDAGLTDESKPKIKGGGTWHTWGIQQNKELSNEEVSNTQRPGIRYMNLTLIER